MNISMHIICYTQPGAIVVCNLLSIVGSSAVFLKPAILARKGQSYAMYTSVCKHYQVHTSINNSKMRNNEWFC